MKCYPQVEIVVINKTPKEHRQLKKYTRILHNKVHSTLLQNPLTIPLKPTNNYINPWQLKSSEKQEHISEKLKTTNLME